VPDKKTAWDCATGTGQIAGKLASLFDDVYATDISGNQISHAVKKSNIIYKKERAENSSFKNEQFDLVTVAQAIHWFDFSAFYDEVKRTLKPKGVIAVIGYSLPQVDEITDLIVNKFYHNVVGQYWDEERRYVDELYRTIPFPFDEINTPGFVSQYKWDLDHFVGYLNTWSAVQHYKDKKNRDPVELIFDELKKSWKHTKLKQVTFPVLLRVGSKE
jgi:SAM-dependent methyltransferase